MVDKCPICDGLTLRSFVKRRNVPAHQNLVISKQDDAINVTRGDLDIAVCADCGFVMNRAFDLSRLAYGKDYDNTQSCSAYFDAYMDGLVADLVEQHGVRGKTIVEVGCGKGQFLKKLVNYPGAGNRGVGFDPSYVGPDVDLDGRVRFERRYYDADCTDVAADIVICRHVIEHVPQPLELLRSVRAALEKAPDARVFFETPCVEWIVRNKVVWDFFYEHCSLFTPSSLSLAFERTGFIVRQVSHIFGGQYLWLEATTGVVTDPVPRNGEITAALCMAYAGEEMLLSDRLLDQLRALRQKGGVALWGAGAKGVTFANMIDQDRSIIDCVIDLNPNKQGGFLPGTGHPIVSPNDAPARGVKSAVLMNPNYRNENLKLLAERGLTLDLIDWSE